MASQTPPTHSEIGDQPPSEDAPPAYNDATGTLDLRQDGLSTQSRVAGQLSTSLPYYDLNSLRDQMTGASTYV
jgi:hypothetical protein